MKKILLAFISICFLTNLYAQNYASFPTESAHWNCLFWHQWQPDIYYLTNYQYIQQGDTILKGKNYKKIYYKELDSQTQESYFGGLREDTVKQIFFFPSSSYLSTIDLHSFPNDTAELLLYTFNNLSIGMNLPINTGQATIQVTGIDSILIGNQYRKRYQIQNNKLLFGPEYWIEGIGSTKDLLSPFAEEFECKYYTLCFSDTTTYYINSPDGNDSCHYLTNIGIFENELNKIELYPNPAKDYINFDMGMYKDFQLSVYNSVGQSVLKKQLTSSNATLNIQSFQSGMYYYQLINDKGKTISGKFVKE
ncbi:MAG: T9SS type A sorting domain-containing protein [Bacteroidetes bacterium]|nr:T9SS type A sorting domain-containing protein [Bacteroidota bacterium]